MKVVIKEYNTKRVRLFLACINSPYSDLRISLLDGQNTTIFAYPEGYEYSGTSPLIDLREVMDVTQETRGLISFLPLATGLPGEKFLSLKEQNFYDLGERIIPKHSGKSPKEKPPLEAITLYNYCLDAFLSFNHHRVETVFCQAHLPETTTLYILKKEDQSVEAFYSKDFSSFSVSEIRSLGYRTFTNTLNAARKLLSDQVYDFWGKVSKNIGYSDVYLITVNNPKYVL